MKNADRHSRLRLGSSKLKLMETEKNPSYGKLIITSDVEECYQQNKG
jgi:hypothetical protein